MFGTISRFIDKKVYNSSVGESPMQTMRNFREHVVDIENGFGLGAVLKYSAGGASLAGSGAAATSWLYDESISDHLGKGAGIVAGGAALGYGVSLGIGKGRKATAQAAYSEIADNLSKHETYPLSAMARLKKNRPLAGDPSLDSLSAGDRMDLGVSMKYQEGLPKNARVDNLFRYSGMSNGADVPQSQIDNLSNLFTEGNSKRTSKATAGGVPGASVQGSSANGGGAAIRTDDTMAQKRTAVKKKKDKKKKEKNAKKRNRG